MRWNFDSPLDRSEYSVLQRQLLAHGRWFSPGTPASSTTKTGCHDIAESGVKHQKSINQPTTTTSKLLLTCSCCTVSFTCNTCVILYTQDIRIRVFCFAYIINLVQPWTSFVCCCCTCK